MQNETGSMEHYFPGLPPIQKQVDHTLDHEGLWFQADYTLDHI